MIKFYDPSGASHFGQATITRTTSVNGGLSLTGEVFDGDYVLNGLDYGWWLNFDNEKYVITYKKLSDDTNTIVFDAVQQFFWDFAKVALHSQYTGSHEYAFYLNQLFNGSGYTYQNDVTVTAFEKENWGYKNKLSLFNDIMDQADVEFEVHNETVHIAKQIGSDLTSFVRKGINLSDLTEEMKISDFATYAKGYGAFKDQQDPSKGRLEVEYRSELAKQFGDLEMDPIVDERYTIADNLIAELKKHVDATYTVSMTMNIYDLESAGYPNYESPKVGDWILAIDEALNFKRKIRIIKLEEQFDVTGNRIGYTATCGDLSIVDQYTNLQGSLDSKVQRIQESIDSVAASANGKNSNYYGAKEPVKANEGDLWFDQSNSDPDKWSIKQWANGRWEQLTLNPGEVDAKVNVAKQEAETAVNNAKSASDKADQLASKYDDTSSLASQAMNKAVSAQSDASSAVATANSTASEFGRVDQKADSAVASALNAQSNASDAVKQASSAAADSKDAKQIAGAVSQSYKTLTDGSTMTIAELESGLAVKLTKTDLDGYATQTWTQNQVKMTADGINGTMSSIKSTVDGQTTSINDLKADSSSFKSQFTTVNNTLGKQTMDISSLQASSKELTTGFNTLTTDNKTNKNDISKLKQTSTEVSSTLETVKTHVQDSAVGTNLLQGTRDFSGLSLNKVSVTNGQGQFQAITGTSPSGSEMNYDLYVFTNLPLEKDTDYTTSFWVKTSENTDIISYLFDSGSNGVYADGGTVNRTTTDYTRFVVHFHNGNNTATPKFIPVRIQKPGVTVWLYGLKLEKGSLATDWSPNPADNATVTALSKLSQTVDGMKADISKKIEQKDLNGYATQTWTQNQIKTTADGINATLSSVKSTVDGHTTSINDLQADSRGFKAQFTTVNNTIGKHTTDIGTLQASNKSLSASFDSLNTDNNTNKHNISQLKLTANSFSSTLATVQQQVTDSAVGTNLLANTADNGIGPVSIQGDTSSPVYTASMTRNSSYIEMTKPKGLEMYYRFCNVDGSMHNLKPGQTYTIQGEVYVSKGSVHFRSQYQPNGGWVNYSGNESGDLATNTSGFVKVKYTFTIPANATAFYLSWQVYSFDATTVFRFRRTKLEVGANPTDYSTNPLDNATVTALSSISQTVDAIQTTVRGKVDNDTYQSDVKQLSGQIESVVKKTDDNFTAIQQTASDINLKVSKDGVINAINVSNEGTSIYGSKLHITADTYIDNATIKDAMIESINATKIRTGTLDADKIDVIHLNADNITAGTIRGTNLTISLDSGNIDFQAGRIHSADNSFDINISDKYISVADSDNRVLISGGEIQMVQPRLSRQQTPYVRISNAGGSSSSRGATFWARDYFVVTNGANDRDAFNLPLGIQHFAGISGGQAANGWKPTTIGGADRGVFISGGQGYSKGLITSSPYITVGDNAHSGSGMNGSNIVMGGDSIYLRSNHTTSRGANAYISPSGEVVPSTSAAKYKTDIVRTFETQMGDKLLEVPVAHWKDKEEVLAKTLDPDAKNPETYFGMIADDLDDAGLNELVEYDDKGAVRGIQYDRVALALIPLIRNYRDRITELETKVKEMKEV